FPFLLRLSRGNRLLDFARFVRAGGCDLKGQTASPLPATCKGYLNST
ncbi:hypothetical protein A2U01_0076294, partial [Trifolium medium]|nr:hypothetical protein [Trifolium medium]